MLAKPTKRDYSPCESVSKSSLQRSVNLRSWPELRIDVYHRHPEEGVLKMTNLSSVVKR
jgi:hypothetical protein